MRAVDLHIVRPAWWSALVWGYARGDAKMAAAVLEAFDSLAGEGSIAAVAARHGVDRTRLWRWVRGVRRVARCVDCNGIPKI